MLTGHHFIAGQRVKGSPGVTGFDEEGRELVFAEGSHAEVDQAAQAAEAAFMVYGQSSRAERAAFLRKIAEEIEARAERITLLATRESHLPEARIQGERGRTIGQLRLFADHIEQGDYLDIRRDAAMPERKPLPRPDLKMVQRPLGPVAVFGASNFPLAFSVAGGDTASALAAGCPVLVKGHPAHPATSEVMAEAIDAARQACGLPAGVFSMLQGGGIEVGQALVQHPLIQAVGFTGSLKAGRALFDLCAARPTPIPFFGELGSINPVFFLNHRLAGDPAAMAAAWCASLTMGAGQFCTNPGIVVMHKGQASAAFAATAQEVLSQGASQTMLTEGIARAYDHLAKEATAQAGVESLVSQQAAAGQALPMLTRVAASTFLANTVLAEEVFGPFGMIVEVEDDEEMLAVARSLQGQLTCTLQMEKEDQPLAKQLLPWLERKAGRVMVNGYPTGVEVCSAMVHGGPYPASTNFGATSVGTMAIRRFVRPVCYQDMPAELLPADLR
ncbi:aldehyde dehydrogenase (NADP(+)) [Pokkaliibacter sp. CJK22405]|uniref:aldehyde dehydrogenase (NADP(+)) n=1 Tax=Pokkaliibacter sp. CJK22405 TaxID=3384615 RepID=UPI0039855E9A